MSGIAFSVRAVSDASKARTQCAVLPLYSDGELGSAGKALDKAGNGALGATLALKDFSAKRGQSVMLPGAGGAARILLLGCGARKDFDRGAARELARALYTALNACKAKDALLLLDELEVTDADAAWLLETIAHGLVTGAYRYTETVAEPKPALTLARVAVSTGAGKSTAQRALDHGAATGLGVNAARNLANLPANICTPSYLAQQARKLARGNSKLKVQVLDEKRMRELGMHSLLSVTAGTTEPARLIVMEYSGGKKSQQPQVLVGKGITFDSGGISLKPGLKMDEMKFDMGGAASVLGTMTAVTAMELPLNVVGVIAAAENMPAGNATKPGDVVKSMAGKTIEILNTDAEGRLVLCDALTYVERFKPEAVIDIATLTGACVVALGSHASGLYSNRDELADALLAAGVESHDRAWRMPLWDEYTKQLQSNFADLANIGGPTAGSVTAACFLAEFTKAYAWAHLDIAGTAWDSAPKWATGRPVGLLTRYLRDCTG
ncbi:leucyl aminopeptidase [Mangrovimicrobium sediminis]|uniref:Probable cytosol aminopeptidase n=1 Tax=Mangrovimicrobium sediminis TaxID=2562682 RepID=A0A4Z0LX08_9GAMM|nr:leucyl aminopeptidase [Haliea sp. SAOS-164]TGD71933.1 leucyl aminopeptidase [Haliea sp. SAOS-164]